DGQTFTPALSAEVSANPVEQVFALDTPVHARFARLRVTSGQVATASRVRIAQWKVIAEPGWSPPGEDGGLELAAPGRGGHLVTMAPLPPGSIALPPLPADGTTHLSIPTEPGQTISWVVGFRDDRAAQITTLTWSDPAGSDPAVRFDEVTVEVSAESPTGPWTPAGTWRLDRSGPDAPRLDLSRPIWARFVRFTGIAGDGGVPDATTVVWELPGPIGVIERAQDDDYRSILGEWGHYRTEAIYERLVPPPVLTLDPDAGDGAEGATALPLDHRVTDSAWVGQDEDWYRVDVPAGETFLAFTLGGDPSLDVNVALFDGAGSRVSLGQEVSSARETIFTAAVEPGASYDLRVTEPPSSIVIAFDTSSSLGPYAATFYPALNRYAGDVQTGQEAVNVLPFGTDPLLDTPSDQPYLLQAAVTNYPRTESSSDSEGTLLTAMDDMADQPGTRAIVLLTDAASSPAPEDLALLWPTLGANTPRVFAVHVSGGGPTAATEQHLMQDWAAVNHGIYAYAVSQGEIDVAFDRAVTLLRRPSVYTLVAEPADPPATPEPEPAATAEPSAAPEPEPTATIPAEPGTLRVVAATVVAGQSAVAAGDASVAIIVDTSGSMLAPLDGTSRADVAKVALVDLVTTTLPPGTDVSLRAFGVVPDSCETRLVVPRAPLDPAAMVDTIQGLEVVNLVRTPLGASLEAVAGDLGTEPGPKIVVFVTDGEETCGGDPAAAIQALIDSGINVRVNIVGFALDDDALKIQFEEWARLGNGRYIDAADGAELAAAVAEAVQPTYDVLDASGTVVARGQVGGDAVSLPPGTYTVVVRSELTQTIDGVIVTSGDETTVTSTGDQTGIGAGPAVDYREVAASRTPP
ncbi:MAG: VWA domain-containing protein, partial [Thermomicrobiales bacterium]